MEPEDEAFEELALKQGHWQHTSGWRKKQIQEPSMTDKEAMAMALDALETLMIERGSIYEKAIAALKERLAQPEPIQSLQCFHCQDTIATLNGKVMRLLAERKEQEPVAVYGYCPTCGAKGVMRERRPNGNDKCANGHTYPSSKANAPPQRTEQNFCSRCGKRTKDIHTCTPPKEGT
jgi:hypothetical protein